MTNATNIDEAIGLILQLPHIIEVRRDDAWEIPKIDTSLWSKDRQLQIETLIEYLSYPYIIDDFDKDHGARREWQKQSSVGEDHRIWGPVYESNCLRGGHIGGALNLTMVLLEDKYAEYTGTNPEEYRRLRDELTVIIKNWGYDVFFNAADIDRMNPGIYGRMPLNQKLELVGRLKGKIYEFLQFLSRQSPIYSQ